MASGQRQVQLDQGVETGKGNVKPRLDVAPNGEPELCLWLAPRLASIGSGLPQS